jgi:S1-C subfamily serine protease
VDTRGALIGINSQILSPTGANIGIGFAIPSNMAKSVLSQLVGKGKVQRGMMGVSIQAVTSDLAQSLGMPAARGIVVNSVNAGGPAEKAGLKTGDVILELNGKDVNDTNEFRNQIAARTPGTEVSLSIWRNGKQQQVRVRLGELTPENAAPGNQGGPGGGAGGRLGISVEPLTPDLAAQLGLRRGTQGLVVTEVDPAGPAGRAGIQAGDVIQEVNRQPVRSVEDVHAAMQRSGDRPPLLLINRGGQTVFVSVPLR